MVGADVGPESGAAGAQDADAREAAGEARRAARRARGGEEENNDVRRAGILRSEIEIAEELTRVAGVGASVRRAGSLAERARLNATRALHKVIDHRGRLSELGHHRRTPVQTGRICSYREDPTYPVTWRIVEARQAKSEGPPLWLRIETGTIFP